MKGSQDKRSPQFVVLLLSKSLLNQQLSWISLGLLLTSYAIQGYLLAQEHLSLLLYPIIVLGYILLQLTILHSWMQRIRNMVRQWVSSDAIHVISFFVLVFLASLILSHLELFEDLLLVLAAEILARLDLQQRGLSQLQKTSVLTLCLTLGLTIGWMASARLPTLQHELQGVVQDSFQLYAAPHGLQQQYRPPQTG